MNKLRQKLDKDGSKGLMALICPIKTSDIDDIKRAKQGKTYFNATTGAKAPNQWHRSTGVTGP